MTVKLLRLLAATLSLVPFAPAAHADVVTIDFTTKGGWNVSPTTVPAIASLTLGLNQDGSVAASLATAPDQAWYGVGIDTGDQFNESDLSQGQVSGWGTAFGEFDTGLVCFEGCKGPITWTITGPDKLTSVRQLFTGTGSAYDAWFFVSAAEYAGVARNAETAGAVPEPATWAMVILGMGAVGYAARRRRRVVPGLSCAA